MASDDVKRAYEALSSKNESYRTYWAYYDGDHPVTYLNERLREVFRNLQPIFTENWCGVVIGACLDRIDLTGFYVADESVMSILDEWWADQDLHQESDDITEAALVCGEAFAIVWPDADGVPQLYYNDPRMCHCFYDAENPRRMTMAAKWWDDDDGRRRMTLYYPDRLEYYISSGKSDNVSSFNSFIPYNEEGSNGEGYAPNPYGQVPVFHFRMNRRSVKSDLYDVIPIQNGVNKLASDMMVASEFQALPQRYVISQTEIRGKLRNAPNEVWDLPASDGIGQATSAGQFEAAPLKSNFLDTIAGLIDHVSAISRTPKHYFFLTSGDPSGEALIAAEAPLNKKCQKRIDRFAPVWKRVAVFMLEIAGVTLSPEEVIPLFAPVETVQPRTEAEIRQLNTNSGVPLLTTLRWEGKSQMELDAVEAEIQQAEEQKQNIGAALLQNFERGGGIADQVGQSNGNQVR